MPYFFSSVGTNVTVFAIMPPISALRKLTHSGGVSSVGSFQFAPPSLYIWRARLLHVLTSFRYLHMQLAAGTLLKKNHIKLFLLIVLIFMDCFGVSLKKSLILFF